MQRDADAEFLHHVRFALEIIVSLHGTGPLHHVEAQSADLLHVSAHHHVAALRHELDIGARRCRVEPGPQHADAKLGIDLLDLRQMRMHLVTGLVQCLQRCTGQLELPARLQRDGTAALRQRDDILAFVNGLPAELVDQPVQDGANAVLTEIGQPLVIAEAEREFLVLRADAPVGARRAAGFQILDELRLAGDRLALGAWGTGHVSSGGIKRLCVPLGTSSGLEIKSVRTFHGPIPRHRLPTGERCKRRRVGTQQPRS